MESDVELYNEYNFKQWIVNNGRIEEAHFQSRSNIIKIPCDIFVSFHPKIIFYKTLLALIDSGLAFNGKLAIHNNFRTSDDHIYAAGSFTMYYKRHARHYNHKYYNSAEIGAEIAMQFVKHLTLLNDKRNNKGKYVLDAKPENIIIDFTQPCIQYGSFPTGWNYLNISKPNGRLHTEISFRTLKNVSVLETGNFNTGPGYFRIVLDENHLVEDIICLTKNAIPYNNYIKLFGKPERLLNSLLIRYQANKIKNFYEYFNEGWAFAIYHDRFKTLENKLHHIFNAGRRNKAHKMRSCDVRGCHKKHFFLKKTEHNSSVTEAILLLMKLNYWEKISLEFQECLDILMNVLSRKRTIMEDAILTFLDDNKNHLTMFTSPSSLLEMYHDQQNFHILENADRHLGFKPLLTEQPEYINVEQKEMKLNKYVNEELYLEKKKIQMDEIIKKRIVRQYFRSRSKKIEK
uniref:CFAP61 dimerisation domain-containing protein n=2 Tax=Rhodnius prolixus TaxID=13249 RepID=T1I8X8_RHOPR